MKKILKLSLIALFAMMSCNKDEKSKIEGAWQLVYANWKMSDTLVYEFPVNMTGSCIKIWSKGHYAIVGKLKKDTAVINDYSGGKYKLEGNNYEEDILYHVFQNSVGQKSKSLLEFRNDTLIQTWPVNEKGEVDKNNYNIEKYVRLD